MPGRRAAKRPGLFVLAGVNGAGKSSVGGAILKAHGRGWLNPDAFARGLQERGGASARRCGGAAGNTGLGEACPRGCLALP